MAMSEEVRKQIILGISVDGTDAPGKLTAEMERLKAQVKLLTEEFGKGEGSAKDYAKEIISLNTQLNRIQKILNEVAQEEKDLAEAHRLAAEAAKIEFITEMNLVSALEKVAEAEKELAKDEQRMLRERLAMIQATKDGVIVMGYHGQALLDEIKAQDQATQATVRMRQAKVALNSTVTTASAGLGRYSTVIGQVGYGLGDLMQTSGSWQQKLMSVTNNVQFAAAQFGPYGVAVGLAATAVASLALNWSTLQRAMQPTTNLFETAGNDVRVMKSELEKATKQMKELADAGKVTGVELETFNRLRKETAVLEEKIAIQMQKQKDIKALGEMTSTREQEDIKTRKESLQSTIGGRTDLLTTQIESEQQAEAQSRIAGLQGRLAGETDPTARAGIKSQIAALQKRDHASFAKDIVARMMLHGDEDATKNIQRMMTRRPEQFDDYYKFAVGQVTPEQLATDRHEDVLQKRAHKAALAHKKIDDETKRLNEQGAANAQTQDAQRATDVTREASRVAAQLAKDISPGGLPAQVAGGFAAGGSEEAVKEQVRALVEQRAGVAGVPASMMKQVVTEIIAKEIDKVRAEAAGNAGDLRAGAAEIVNEMKAKVAQHEDTAARKPITRAARDAADRAKQQLANVTQDIEAHTGLPHEVAQIAAKDAINRWKHGQDATVATWSAVQDMMEKIVMMNAESAGSQVLFMQKLQHLEAQIAMQGRQARGNNRRAQNMMNPARPALLPNFGPN